MFLKLLKLIIKSRFSWSYFAIIFVFVVYGLTSITLSRLPTGASYSEYYFAGILSLFSAIGVLMGGLSMTRSDSEFLVVSPIKRRTFSAVLYIGQYLYTGPLLFITFLIYAMTSPYDLHTKLVLVGDVFLLSTIPVSLSVNSSNLKLLYKIPATAALVLWIFSFQISFSFSPVAFSTGDLYPSLIATLALSLFLLARSLVMLSSGHLAYRVLDRGAGNSTYRYIRDYTNISPRRAILRYGFSQFEIATRSNFSGTPTLSGRRIRITLVFLLFSIAAVVYGYVAYTFFPHNSSSLNFATLLGSIYIGVFPPIILAAGTMPMERAWLSFTSMRPGKYMPYLTAVKMIQMFCVMAAFAVVDLALFFLGVRSAINGIPVFLIYSPLFLGIFIEINFRSQHYQIKDEKLIVSRYSATQFVLAPVIIVFFIITAASSLLPFLDLFIIPVIAVIAAIPLFWKSFWDNRVYKLVEKGFV